MSSSDPTDDFSDWSNLAADLGLDSSAKLSTAAHAEPIPDDVASSIFSEESLPDADDSEDTSLEPNLQGEPLGDGSDDGTKKRRRRRRRKKGKGGPESAEDATGEESVEQATEVDGDYEIDAEPQAVAVDDEDEQGSHMARETIRTWDVPSWDEIVAGLYRPNR